MKSRRIVHSVVLALVLFFLLRSEKREYIMAAIVAALIHELGHLLALTVLDLKINCIKLELTGLRIDYSGISTPMKDVLIALAGPATGMLYYWLLGDVKSGLLLFSTQLSLAYSLFNLLPVLPLDGGRALLSVTQLFYDDLEYYVTALSYVLSFVLFGFGIVWMLRGEGNALLAVALWLLLLQT